MADKLDQAKRLIADLEKKNRDLERQAATLPEILEQMRKKNNQDLEKLRKEMEDEYRKNVSVLL